MQVETKNTVEIRIEDCDLGEIGYSAYRAKTGGVSLVSGQKIPEWEVLPESIQEAWTAAARAINITVATRISDGLGLALGCGQLAAGDVDEADDDPLF